MRILSARKGNKVLNFAAMLGNNGKEMVVLPRKCWVNSYCKLIERWKCKDTLIFFCTNICSLSGKIQPLKSKAERNSLFIVTEEQEQDQCALRNIYLLKHYPWYQINSGQLYYSRQNRFNTTEGNEIPVIIRCEFCNIL